VSILLALGPVPLAVLADYVVLSAVLFAVYGLDKRAAVRGTWRTPEVTLHLLAAAGGWPGALAAQRLFRHKTRKQPFQAIYWCTVAANLAALAWILSALRTSAG
jgi:uncharacterized membrane protein YsdA (DUF1294 family)